jgi:CRP/FNR family transcriptional regulator, cyclic AMP receptor protein
MRIPKKGWGFRGPSTRVAPGPADLRLGDSSTNAVGCDDRDRLHWTRSRLMSALDHQPNESKRGFHIERGESACVEGQLAEALFLVQRGLLKLSVVSSEGTQSVSEIVGMGDCFGEECAAEGRPHYAETAIALMPTALIKIARQEVLRKLEVPDFAKLYVSALIHRVHEYEGLLAQHVFENSEQRLARVLTRLAKFGHWQNRNTVVVPRLTHETLSEVVGTTRSRITFFMGKLERHGIVLNHGHGLSLDMDRLFNEVLRQPWHP